MKTLFTDTPVDAIGLPWAQAHPPRADLVINAGYAEKRAYQIPEAYDFWWDHQSSYSALLEAVPRSNKRARTKFRACLICICWLTGAVHGALSPAPPGCSFRWRQALALLEGAKAAPKSNLLRVPELALPVLASPRLDRVALSFRRQSSGTSLWIADSETNQERYS